MTTTTRESINNFLRQRRLAIVGVSRNPQDFSRSLFKEFRARGYDVVPVNPNVAEIDGQPCYKRVQDIKPAVDGALLLTTPQVTEQVIRDCAEAGIKRVWMQRGEGIGAVSPAAVAFCTQNGIDVVPGQCPFMFLPNTAFFHRAHGFFRKLTGSYPV
ncbi:MAG: CoA-binding protein [Chloroflexi bacterium]|nr:CoA-binding protein [Chloroflexota bacterium]